MKRSCLLLVLLAPFANVRAQHDGSYPDHADKVEFKFLFQLDARRTVVYSDPVRFFGFRVGAQRNKDIMTLGFYGFDNPWVDNAVALPDLGLDNTTLRSSLSYGALTYERVFFENRRWMLSGPVMLGLGHVTMDYKEGQDRHYRPYAKSEVVPIEAGVRAAFKLTFWLYIQGGVGYRKVYTDALRAEDVYTGVTWNYGISIKTGKIFNYARERIKQNRRLKHANDG